MITFASPTFIQMVIETIVLQIKVSSLLTAPFHAAECFAGTCKVVFRLSDPAQNTYLNLQEVKLYGQDGSQIDPSTLAFALSTTYQELVANNCNDGVLTGGESVCATGTDDPDPRLMITYPCPKGLTSLSTVEVYNREGCCQDRINSFTMDFVNSDDISDRASYVFSGGQSKYVYQPGELL